MLEKKKKVFPFSAKNEKEKEEKEEKIDISSITEKVENKISEKTPKKEKRGRKSNAEIQAETQQVKNMLYSTMAHSLMSISVAISKYTDPKWAIRDIEEATLLGTSFVDFLDAIYPNWASYSPILNFAMAISTYVTPRLLMNDSKRK